MPIQAVLLFWNLDLLDPWGDEWFTLQVVPQPIKEVASMVGGNIHPPLYFFLLHYWIEIPSTLSLIARMRAMSVVWTLVATLTVYWFWLRREEPALQRMFLGLWILSPCLLLHGRMARSYSLQLALAPVTLWAALRWIERPQEWKRLLVCACTVAALLYTHYLSGLAVAATVGLMVLLKRDTSRALIYGLIIGVLYAPWLPTFIGALGRWRTAAEAPEGNVAVDQLVRLGYLFVSFGFGETFTTLSVILAAILTPIMIYAIWQSLRARPKWLAPVSIAVVLGWIGVTRWAQFEFMTTGLIFALPFFLLLVVRRIPRPAFVALVALYLSADFAYFQRSGYLVKPYAAPFREMADVIRDGSHGRPALLALDGAFSDPMLQRLPGNIKAIELDDPSSADVVKAAAGNPSGGPEVIWLWRHTRDVSPGGFITALESDLLSRGGQRAGGRPAADHVRRYDFVPYSQVERWARRVLRGPGQADYYYRIVRVERALD